MVKVMQRQKESSCLQWLIQEELVHFPLQSFQSPSYSFTTSMELLVPHHGLEQTSPHPTSINIDIQVLSHSGLVWMF